MTTASTKIFGATEAAQRRRGKSKAPNFRYTGPVSTIRLELDASDDHDRQRLERHWATVFQLRRALQRDAGRRCRAFWRPTTDVRPTPRL